MKKRLQKIIAILLVVSLYAPITVNAVSVTDFNDMKTSDWCYEAVEYAVSHNLFAGTSTTTFSPNTAMTRGMFVTVLGRLANVEDTYGRTKTTPFNDVTQADYFFPYTAWANDNDYVSGVGNKLFNPNGEITREQIATILFRYFEQNGFELQERQSSYNTFADTSKVSSYAVTAMQWATTYGIINGSDGKLNPQDNATRAQVAQMLCNFNELEQYAVNASAQTPEQTPEDDTNVVDWQNYDPTYTPPTGKSATDANGGYFDYDLAAEIMEQVNAVRIESGVDALKHHPKIQEWAGVRAMEQVTLQGHTRPDGSDCLSVGDGLSSENITILNNVSESELANTSELAARAVNNWYTSTNGHKEAMLSYAPNLASVSCYVKGNTVYVVELFSNRTMYFMDILINQ